MPLLLHQPLLLLNASADHHLPWRRSSPISSCQGAVTELALPQPWTPSGHPSPISPRPHPLAAAPSYSWWLSLLPWMLAVLPSLVLTSAPCVGWPVAPALGLSSANSAPSIPARILLIGPAQIILMPGRGTTAIAMKPHRVAPSTCSTEYRSTCRPDLQPWLRGRRTPLPSTLCLALHQCNEMSERIDDMRPEFDSARLFDVYFTHCDLVDDVFTVSYMAERIVGQGSFGIVFQFKLCKVRSVLFGQKGIPYLNTYDGRTMRYPDPLIKANDTIKIDLETNKIMDFIKLYLPFHGLYQVIYLVRLNVSTNS
ncbi:40S ribosomal protein S4-3 [Zea mays]|uniref:40S ribosomal protein S4-3 n=1 Tax=Zea mays TaxID=4577 RepID=A0A1D6GF59_MAIZE|nr:40S ribosomal protein S4-3 [Zea mays]